MKPLSAALPPGVGSPPASKPTSGPPRPEPVESPLTPGVCALCADHYPEIGGTHYRVSNETPRGEYVGPCTAPKKAEAKSEAPKPRPRTHEECSQRLREMATRGSAARMLLQARETHATHSQPREPGEDDE